MATDPPVRGEARLLELLWRSRATPEEARRGRPARIGVDEIVAAGILSADGGGAEAVTMRGVAERLGVGPMTLYTHVPDKDALVALMADSVLLGMTVSEPGLLDGWRERLRLVAADNRALLLRHPWMLELRPARPPLGPGLLAKYEWELSALAGLELSPLETDSALTFLLEFVRASVADSLSAERAARAREDSGEDWWAAVGPVLARFVSEEEFPLATRIGAEAGAMLGAAHDPDYAYRFGLERVLDGIAVLVRR